MIYRKLDQNGDYVFGGNGSCYISGLDAVKQAILTRLRLLLGEWWEDETDGLPLWQKILAARDKKEVERQILNRISGTPHVLAITGYQTEWNGETRKLSIHVEFSSEYGDGTLDEVMA